jgi:hypothetical protein
MKDLIRRILRESLTSTDIETYDEMNKFVVDNDIHNVKYFKQNFPNEYKLSNERDWLLKLAKENDFDDFGDKSRRKIYVFEWNNEEPKKVYVGLTHQPDVRYHQHLRKLVKNNPNPDQYFVLQSKFISDKEAQRLEGATVCDYKKKGYKIVNKKYSKSLGYCTKDLSDYWNLIDKAISSGTESIKSENSDLYDLIKKGRLSKIGAIPTPRIKNQEKETKKDIPKGGSQKYINIETGEVYRSLNNAAKELNIDQPTLYYNIKNKGNYNDIIFPFNFEEEPMVDMEIDSDYDEMNETKRFVKKIIEEQTENSEKKKGIDLAIKMLKKSYPYIIGWKYDEERPERSTYINIDIICDIEKTKEFYNSDLKWYYKKNPEDIKEDNYAYPFTILEIGEKMTGEEKFQEYRNFKNQLNEIYEMLPENLIILNKWNEPKEIEPDKYFFE